MNKQKMTSLQFSCLISYPILSIYSGISTYNITKGAGVNSYLSIIVSYLLGIILLFLFLLIFHYKEKYSLLEKNLYLFGHFFGTCINIIINILLFSIGIILFYNISNFAISQFLDQTPIIIFMTCLGLLLVYNVSKGIKNIARVSFFFMIIVFLLNIISFLGLLPHFHLNNLKPFLEYGGNDIFKNGINLLFTNIVPMFSILIIEKNKIVSDANINKKLFIFYTFAFLTIFISNFLTLGTLGVYLTRLYQYPEYIVLQQISLFNFVDRIENFIYIKWVLTSVICLSLIIYHVCKMFYDTNVKFSSPIITVLMIALSLIFFQTNTYFYTVSYYIFPYICAFLLAIYIIIGINILLRLMINYVILLKKKRTF